MASQLQLGTGQLTMLEVADKINTNSDLASMRARLGGAPASPPDIFPDEWNGFIYMRFRGSFPYNIDGEAQNLTVLFTCYGTPVITSNVGWITGFDTHGEINGDGSDVLSISKNTSGSSRVGTITITVTQPLGTYSIDTTVTQAVPATYSPVSLGYDASNDQDACQDYVFTPVTMYTKDPETFPTATQLFRNASGGNATAGWYSDGSIARYWTGAVFSGQQNCTI